MTPRDTPDREPAETDVPEQTEQPSSAGRVGAIPEPDRAEIAALSYEQARDELAGIVARLEGGQLGLEESMALWKRGEALAEHCSAWLEGAQRVLAEDDPAED